MPRLLRARVQVPVILWQQVNVVEYETVEISNFQSLLVPNVHQHGSVERPVSILFYYEDGVVQLLSFEERMHVLQEQQQVLPSTSERYDYGHFLQYPA